MLTPPSLTGLGWNAFFSGQLTLEDLSSLEPARLAGVHRSGVTAWCERGPVELVVPRDMQRDGVAATLAVGDWVLASRGVPRIVRRLDRLTSIERIGAGRSGRRQTIAANIDTLLVVSSCNADLNPSRLERYLAIALDAGVTPVIVLTKADTCADPASYAARARLAAPHVEILTIDATQPACIDALSPWLGTGQTLACVGSSGVGKSTLVNTLTGQARQGTAGIREQDGRGRHTTTSRELIPIPAGAWLIDTPGMRELRIGAVESGVDETFSDITALAMRCRFRDCRHDSDDGCALAEAVEKGRLAPRRLANYLKLEREASRARRSLRERRDAERRLGKHYKSILRDKRDERR